jgi:DNA-binding NtrC family response regulator
MAKILVVDDEVKLRNILKIMLSLHGHQVDEAGNGREALEKMGAIAYDLIISDIRMPEMDGLTFLDQLKENEISCPVIIITAFATVESAVEAMKRGAIDYITKPFDESRIILTVEKAVGIGRVVAENKELKRALEGLSGGHDLVFASPAMGQIVAMAEKVAAKAGTTVLLSGESGVGKEVVARFIHQRSPRAANRFVATNCSAISPALIESTIFGHEKGAFTGADKRSAGLFEYAGQGTVFLDEIGDLSLEVQAKLLRVLQEKVVQRVGGHQEVPVDARVICATNRNLVVESEAGRFRSDLFFRINVFPVQIPPLRARVEDILPLARYFIQKNHARADKPPQLTPGAEKILMTYHWPGNVRELANAMERAVILADGDAISSEHLHFLGATVKMTTISVTRFTLPRNGIPIEQLEQSLIKQALEMTARNQSAAAQLLGLTRSKLRTRIKQLGNDAMVKEGQDDRSEGEGLKGAPIDLDGTK